MALTERDLKEMFKQVKDREQIPGFEPTWQAARQGLEQKRAPFTRWRWCMGPTVFLFASAAVALLLVAVGNQPDTAAVEVAALHEAGVGPHVSDEHAVLPELRPSLADLTDDEGGEASQVAAGDEAVEPTLYEVPTDFLLDLEAPRWDEAEKESLL